MDLLVKKLLLIGVMSLGLGLTSALTAQHKGSKTEIEPNPERVTESVVVKKKDIQESPYFKKLEVMDYNELLRQLNEAKRREDARRAAELETIKKRRQEYERQQRLAEERRQRELAKKRAQQLTEQKLRQPTQVVETLYIEFTYYTANCKGCSGKTSTGYDVRNTVYYNGMRILATDPNVIPTYSIARFEINGEMVIGIALDKGGAIKGHKVDMLVTTRQEAITLGRQVKKVEILRYGK